MRDAFGGSFMLKLAVIFIILYISFLAMAVNYAKAFRVKNKIIDLLEQNQYTGSTLSEDTEMLEKINKYLDEVHYKNLNIKDDSCTNIESNSDGEGEITDHGICIISKGSANNRVYEVRTYLQITMPFFSYNPLTGNSFDIIIPISGETSTINYNYKYS